MELVITKVCKECGVEKAITCFGKHSVEKDGIRSKCKQCQKEYNLKRYTEKKDIISEKAKLYYQKNSDEIYKATRKWQIENADKAILMKRKSYIKHRDRYLIEQREYRKTDISKASVRNAHNKRRVVSKDSNVRTIFIHNMRTLSTSCFYCGCSIDKDNMHIDHYVPLSKGGAHSEDNLVASCATCNLQKGAKMPLDFIKNREVYYGV